jgi:hypothetical protein
LQWRDFLLGFNILDMQTHVSGQLEREKMMKRRARKTKTKE